MNADLLELRPDLRVIAEMVKPGSSLLDVGSGEGDLLAWLERHRQVKGRGMEISQSGVNRCIARGLSVIQGDADTDLEYYADQFYDYVVLSQTLQTLRQPQAVLEHLVRIGKHAIVSVPNFAHWKNRLYLLTRGRMPVTRSLSYQWYDTPNIHFCTIADFVELCEAMRLSIEQRLTVGSDGQRRLFRNKSRLANMFGEQGIFMLTRKEERA
uniref:Methionine biosynthesis protein MetW n=1 Tax=uncultured bacterium CSL1 TaxID=1091565 RepID=G4WVA6_9BACT|nr:methionine biosynthesis protein MetW [uncultured bacterium CSL1]